jgi:Fe-S cluster biogenesis protein NfuA
MNNKEVIDQIKDLLDRMRPFLINDGGDLEFIEYKDNKVYVRLTGACKDCAMIDYTLKDGIEEMIKTEIPEVEEVINVE